MAKQPKTTVVAATGTAGGGDPGGYSSSGIEGAMTAAAEQCARKRIVDPDEVRTAKLRAREEYKAGVRASAAKAAKAAKAGARAQAD